MDVRRLTVLCAASVVALLTIETSADVRLPRLVSDHMILQRDAKVPIWGWANPGEEIRIGIAGQSAHTRADHLGQWSAVIGPLSAGGPYDLTVSASNTIHLHDVLVGDVWVASGQSNMEFPLKGSGDWRTGVYNADHEVSGARFPQMRLFKVHQKVALRPATDVDADAWASVTPETVGNFSAVAYLFGRELHQRYRVPIGLIETALGGTAAEAWVSAAGLGAFPEFHASIDAVRRAGAKAGTADHDRYVKERAEWDHQHASEDRGLVAGRAAWADPALDATAWPTVAEPQMKPEEALKGFDGAVWFRKEIFVPRDQAGRSVQIHLTGAGKTDSIYFNGQKVGQTDAWEKPRDYTVPAELVRAGRNVITIRMTGSDGYVGMFDFENPGKQYVQAGDSRIPLAGAWSYQPGPDLSAFPQPSEVSKLINHPNTPTLLYNGMIEPLTRFRIKGVIWYQGEANAIDNRAAQYRKLFPALIGDWRNHWGYEVPFLFVQLAGYGHNKSDPAEYSWADLREAQSMALSNPATGMATAIDIGDENDIHPKNKQEVAHRLALAAANVAYGEEIVDSGPTFESMRVEGDHIRIKFSSLGGGLVVRDRYGYARGFEVAGADGRFRWAQARQDGNEIFVFSEAIRSPVAVRYDWCNTPDGNVYNKEGLPAVPFRTDPPTGAR